MSYENAAEVRAAAERAVAAARRLLGTAATDAQICDAAQVLMEDPDQLRAVEGMDLPKIGEPILDEEGQNPRMRPN